MEVRPSVMHLCCRPACSEAALVVQAVYAGMQQGGTL